MSSGCCRPVTRTVSIESSRRTPYRPYRYRLAWEATNLNLDVRTNPATGSVLILHQSSLDPIAQQALDLKLFEVAERDTSLGISPGQYVEQAIAGIGIAEQLIRRDTRFRNITLGTLVAAGLYQGLRGSLLPAGLTIFAYAITVLNRSRT